jgi:glutathione-regulated potassium-efflux system ancillary protein KefF
VSAPILVVYAHPYPNRSRANRVLVDAVRDLENLELRSLYALYPDFDIDVAAEQAALTRARIVVWQHPLYWYTVPGLLKHWFDKVLTRGWAYGDGGTALAGKICQWVTSTGAGADGYQPGGMHHHVFDAFVPVVEQTARFCNMEWEPPLVVHGAHKISERELEGHAERYRSRLIELAKRHAPEAA